LELTADYIEADCYRQQGYRCSMQTYHRRELSSPNGILLWHCVESDAKRQTLIIHPDSAQPLSDVTMNI